MYLLTALAIVPLTPFVGRFLPFFNADTVLVTVAKAFLLLLIVPFFPKLLLNLTAFIPADIALLNFEAFLVFFTTDSPLNGFNPIVGISPSIGLYKKESGTLGSPYISASRLACSWAANPVVIIPDANAAGPTSEPPVIPGALAATGAAAGTILAIAISTAFRLVPGTKISKPIAAAINFSSVLNATLSRLGS